MVWTDRHRLSPGRSVHLDRVDPADASLFRGGKRRAERERVRLVAELDRLQELFYADGRHGLLVVLQGMDTAGKDGTIRHVFEGVNPQGVRVAAFKVPTPLERSHDFLWRVHAMTPRRGEIVVFNRSHYEDVLAARVHHLVPRGVWSHRYRSINQFERELADEGTRIVKFFLHVSREEQTKRLEERRHDPTKHWKFSASDLAERPFWPRYREAYDELLGRTSTAWAPWYVVPSDHKWYRNLVVSTVLVDLLDHLKLRYPPSDVDLAKVHLDR